MTIKLLKMAAEFLQSEDKMHQPFAFKENMELDILDQVMFSDVELLVKPFQAGLLPEFIPVLY